MNVHCAVRLRSTSDLLFIETIDNDAAIAFCRRFGESGPEGDVEPYPLDSLRENIIRVRNIRHELDRSSWFQKIRCRLNFHARDVSYTTSRPMLGKIEARACRFCGSLDDVHSLIEEAVSG